MIEGLSDAVGRTVERTGVSTNGWPLIAFTDGTTLELVYDDMDLHGHLSRGAEFRSDHQPPPLTAPANTGGTPFIPSEWVSPLIAAMMRGDAAMMRGDSK